MSHTQTMLSTGEASRPYLEKGAPRAFAAISGAGIGQDGGELIASSKVNVVARNRNVRAAAALDHAIADAFEQVSVMACLAEVETFIRATSASAIRFEF